MVRVVWLGDHEMGRSNPGDVVGDVNGLEEPSFEAGSQLKTWSEERHKRRFFLDGD